MKLWKTEIGNMGNAGNMINLKDFFCILFRHRDLEIPIKIRFQDHCKILS